MAKQPKSARLAKGVTSAQLIASPPVAVDLPTGRLEIEKLEYFKFNDVLQRIRVNGKHDIKDAELYTTTFHWP